MGNVEPDDDPLAIPAALVLSVYGVIGLGIGAAELSSSGLDDRVVGAFTTATI